MKYEDVRRELERNGFRTDDGRVFTIDRTRWMLGVIPWHSRSLLFVTTDGEGRVQAVEYFSGAPYI
jgi:hypothetical protein